MDTLSPKYALEPCLWKMARISSVTVMDVVPGGIRDATAPPRCTRCRESDSSRASGADTAPMKRPCGHARCADCRIPRDRRRATLVADEKASTAAERQRGARRD